MIKMPMHKNACGIRLILLIKIQKSKYNAIIQKYNIEHFICSTNCFLDFSDVFILVQTYNLTFLRILNDRENYKDYLLYSEVTGNIWLAYKNVNKINRVWKDWVKQLNPSSSSSQISVPDNILAKKFFQLHTFTLSQKMIIHFTVSHSLYWCLLLHRI